MKEMVSSFAARLNEMIDERGYQVTKLAEGAGVNKGNISRYRQGYIVPKDDIAKRLAEFMGVNPEWLKGYDVPKYPQPIPSDGESRKEIVARWIKQEATPSELVEFINEALNKIQQK